MSMFKRFSLVILASLVLVGFNAHAATDTKISVQLWSVKDDLNKDFEGTLKKLSAMGFQGVEFAGNFGPYEKDPKGLKAFLKSINLEASGAHVGFDKLNDENLKATAVFYKALGAKYLVVPYDQRAFEADNIDALVKDLNAAAKKLKRHRLLTGYHNHAPEFGAFKDSTYWDYIAQNTSKDVVMQLDAGWATVAGKDAAAYIRKYPNRTYATHIKAGLPEGLEGKQPFIGQDIADWKAIVTAAREVGGTKWLVVEQEVYPNGIGQLEAVEISMKGFQVILKDLAKK